MGMEIERRFVVDITKLPELTFCSNVEIIQGYFETAQSSPIVRIRLTNDKSFITIKSKIAIGKSLEYEYEIPHQDAIEILDRLSFKVSKRRFTFPLLTDDGFCTGLMWEVDFFKDFDVVIAEVELPDIMTEFKVPDWCLMEITNIKGVSNFDMAHNPEKVEYILKNLDK